MDRYSKIKEALERYKFDKTRSLYDPCSFSPIIEKENIKIKIACSQNSQNRIRINGLTSKRMSCKTYRCPMLLNAIDIERCIKDRNSALEPMTILKQHYFSIFNQLIFKTYK